MRKLCFLFMALLFLSGVVSAGEVNFKLGGALGFPTGDFGKYYSIGPGANAGVIYQLNDQIDLVGGLEFFYFHLKDHNARILRLTPDVGGRFKFYNYDNYTFFAEAGLGITIDQFKYEHYDAESNTDLSIRISAGALLNNIELLASYRIVRHSDYGESEAFNVFALSAAYRF